VSLLPSSIIWYRSNGCGVNRHTTRCAGCGLTVLAGVCLRTTETEIVAAPWAIWLGKTLLFYLAYVQSYSSAFIKFSNHHCSNSCPMVHSHGSRGNGYSSFHGNGKKHGNGLAGMEGNKNYIFPFSCFSIGIINGKGMGIKPS